MTHPCMTHPPIKVRPPTVPGINPVPQGVKRIPGVGINLVPVGVKLVARGRVDRVRPESMASRGSGIVPVEGRCGAAGEMLRTGDLRTEIDVRWGSGGGERDREREREGGERWGERERYREECVGGQVHTEQPQAPQ